MPGTVSGTEDTAVDTAVPALMYVAFQCKVDRGGSVYPSVQSRLGWGGSRTAAQPQGSSGVKQALQVTHTGCRDHGDPRLRLGSCCLLLGQCLSSDFF